MSLYSKEATAKFELDKAEKEIFDNAKDFEKLFEFLKGAAKKVTNSPTISILCHTRLAQRICYKNI